MARFVLFLEGWSGIAAALWLIGERRSDPEGWGPLLVGFVPPAMIGFGNPIVVLGLSIIFIILGIGIKRSYPARVLGVIVGLVALLASAVWTLGALGFGNPDNSTQYILLLSLGGVPAILSAFAVYGIVTSVSP
jgi:hypothetical protein